MSVTIFKMKWQGDTGLELYVASSKFPDPTQQEASQSLLRLLDGNGLRERMDIFYLGALSEQSGFFDLIRDPKKEMRLPFLVWVYGCSTGAVLGYSGLEDITTNLKTQGLMKRE